MQHRVVWQRWREVLTRVTEHAIYITWHLVRAQATILNMPRYRPFVFRTDPLVDHLGFMREAEAPSRPRTKHDV